MTSDIGRRTSDAVLFIGFGGPEKREDVMPFLEIVTKGRPIPPERLLEVAHHYEVIGGKSPINEITRGQVAALERELKAQGVGLPLYLGQRNWHPFLEDTLGKMAKDGIKRAIGFPAAAHRSEPSLERYVNAVERARQNIGPQAPVIDFVSAWYDHPLFIDAITARVHEVLARVPEFSQVPWFFTAHSIPCCLAKDSFYVSDLKKTAEAVAQKFGKKEWGLAYSSRSGNPKDPWLEPDVNRLITEQAAKGTRKLLFIPIGFIGDHVEILFDLDVEAQQTAKKETVHLERSRSVGDHPLFVRMMAEVIRARMSEPETPEQRSSKAPAYSDCFCFPGDTDAPCQRIAALVR